MPATTDTADANKILSVLNTRGGGTGGSGNWIADLAGSISAPVVRTKELLDQMVTDGYVVTNGNLAGDPRSDFRTQVYKITAAGVTFLNS